MLIVLALNILAALVAAIKQTVLYFHSVSRVHPYCSAMAEIHGPFETIIWPNVAH